MSKTAGESHGLSSFAANKLVIGRDGFLKSKLPVRAKKRRNCGRCGKELAKGNPGKNCFACQPRFDPA